MEVHVTCPCRPADWPARLRSALGSIFKAARGSPPKACGFRKPNGGFAQNPSRRAFTIYTLEVGFFPTPNRVASGSHTLWGWKFTLWGWVWGARPRSSPTPPPKREFPTPNCELRKTGDLCVDSGSQTRAPGGRCGPRQKICVSKSVNLFLMPKLSTAFGALRLEPRLHRLPLGPAFCRERAWQRVGHRILGSALSGR